MIDEKIGLSKMKPYDFSLNMDDITRAAGFEKKLSPRTLFLQCEAAFRHKFKDVRRPVLAGFYQAGEGRE
jgi:hypothetical protein